MTLDELLSQYMPEDDALRDIGEFFSVFSHETRIKIMILLSVSELNVNDLSKCLGLNQSTVSHQLRILKDRKIVNCACSLLHLDGFIAVCRESLPLFSLGLFWLIPAAVGVILGLILRAGAKKQPA